MALDFGFDFRDTLAFVTDPATSTFVGADAYPTTYTNGNGQSINGGYLDTSSVRTRDRVNTYDPRIAGCHFNNGAVTITFQIDLASGSGGGATSYTLDGGFGDQGELDAAWEFTIKDTSTVLESHSGSFGTSTDWHGADVTGATFTTSAGWVSGKNTVTDAFATTTCLVLTGPTSTQRTGHFRLTESGGGVTGFGPLLGGQRNYPVLA